MAAAAILENYKSQYLRNRSTDFQENSHGDAHWHSLCRRTFKSAIL